MSKNLLAALLLPLAVSVAFAQSESASAPKPAASGAKKSRLHLPKLHAPKLRPGATPAVNPEASPDKKGGQ